MKARWKIGAVSQLVLLTSAMLVGCSSKPAKTEAVETTAGTAKEALASPPKPSCGDGKVDPQSEQCEPPNTATCDAKCQATQKDPCTVCSNTKCRDPFVATCQALGEPCLENVRCIDADGDAAGETPKDKSCAAEATQNLFCYCGATEQGDCYKNALGAPNGPKGPCAAIIQRTSGCGAEFTTPDAVGSCVRERFIDPDYPNGVAYQLAICQRESCKTECGI